MAPRARRQNPAVSGTAPKFFRHTTLRSPVLAAISPIELAAVAVPLPTGGMSQTDWA